MAEKHECKPPMESRPKDAPMSWTCPDCQAVWDVRVVSEGFTFYQEGGGKPFTNAEWVRRD